VNALPPPQRAAKIKALRAQERALRQTWLSKPGQKPPPPKPPRTRELPPEVQRFVSMHLLPRLSDKEKEQLRKAEGRWPDLPRTILALSERHPVLPPLPGKPITHYNDLPVAVALQVARNKVRRLEGKWPDFALAVVRRLRNIQVEPAAPLGACRPADFPGPTRAFLEKRLPELLSASERTTLAGLEGRWPEYPLQLHRLARQHRFAIPGMSLPGPRELWESARTHLPDVPDRTLHQFALIELTPQQRADMGISLADPAGSREKIKKAYYKKHARELQRRGFDMKALLGETR
jgi:hypothetical protein